MEYLSQKKGFLGYDASQNIDPKVVVVPIKSLVYRSLTFTRNIILICSKWRLLSPIFLWKVDPIFPDSRSY